jgi:hypothetical protein
MLKVVLSQLQRLSIGQFIIIITAINLLQAAFTQLSADEAYYYYYSQHLKLGYFDHPPMIALLIKLGAWLGGSLGVRLVSVLLHSIGIYLLWLINKGSKHTTHFYTVYLCIIIYQLMGFIATPDSPLLFFSICFWYIYQRYLLLPKYSLAIWLGLCMAAMVYSKYHAVVFIILVLLSNWQLIKQPQAWLAVSIALVVFTPHLWWQYMHNFPSFKYHLVQRASGFSWQYLPEYILNIILLYNLLLFIIIGKAWPHVATTPFSKSLLWVCAGFLLFFAFTTLRGHTQPQWIILIAPCLILLISKMQLPIRHTLLSSGISIALVIVFITRILLCLPTLPIYSGFNGNKQMIATIDSLATGKPIVFGNSYQLAALYNFYAPGKVFYSNRNYYGRANEFTITTNDSILNGDSVLYITGDNFNSKKIIIPQCGNKTLYYNYLKYQQYTALELYMPVNSKGCITYLDTIYCTNNYNHAITIGGSSFINVGLYFTDAEQKDKGLHIIPTPLTVLQPHTSTPIILSNNVLPKISGTHTYLKVFLQSQGYDTGPVTNAYTITH